MVEKVRVGDIEIAYRWDGGSDGPGAMMAHAMGTSHRIRDPQVPALADRYLLLRYESPGAGGDGHGDAGQGPASGRFVRRRRRVPPSRGSGGRE